MVPKSIPIVSSFQIKKPRKTPNTAFYGVLYCRQRGSNPHGGVCLSSWFGIVPKCVSKKWKWHFLDNYYSTKKEPHRTLLPQGSYREKRMLAENVLLPIRSCSRPYRTHDTHFPNYARKSVRFQGSRRLRPVCQLRPMIYARGRSAEDRRKRWIRRAMP